LTSKIDYFTGVETLKEEWQETNGFEELKTGHYKFIVDNKPVYILWDEDLPANIKGQVKVTYANGEERITDASEIELSDIPVFIEL